LRQAPIKEEYVNSPASCPPPCSRWRTAIGDTPSDFNRTSVGEAKLTWLSGVGYVDGAARRSYRPYVFPRSFFRALFTLSD